MVFSSIIFILFFLPLFLIIYYISGKKLKNYVLLAFSVIFYAWGAPQFLFLLLGSTFANFYIIKKMYYTSSTGKKNILASASVIINLGLLAYFKYANFFVENVNFLLDFLGASTLQWTKIILPIGISFFTFQSLTYTVDVYRRIHAPLKNPLDYVLYIIMFPQLIAGPIVRFETIANQITTRNETNDERLTGFYRFIIGLSKKVLIADVLGMEVNNIMSLDLSTIDATTAWTGILAYSFQIYFDFSGYSDMAIGMGRMIGFKFPENFNNPYTASSITEFWRRWHITFTTFMRYYLYYPLGGNRVSSKYRLYINLMLVFLVSGLWHGASWNFIIWGLIHGFFLIIERVFLSDLLSKLGKVPGIIYTFFVVILAWVPFRVETLPDTIIYFDRLFSFEFSALSPEKTQVYVMTVIALLISMITLSRFGLKLQDKIYEVDLSNKQHILYFFTAMIFLILTIATLAGSGFSPFIYFRF